MDEAQYHATFTTREGIEVKASLEHWDRHAASLLVQIPGISLQTSEILGEFKLILNGQVAYSGNATIAGLVPLGAGYACQVVLEDGWLDLHTLAISDEVILKREFAAFQQGWQQHYQVSSEFKLIVADLQIYLTDLRIWLEQVEHAIRSSPSGDRIDLERKVLHQICGVVLPALDAFFDRYEALAQKVSEKDWPAHSNYAKRQLHPLILCAPFVYRTFVKPFGYAGDYEMVDMIARNQFEGGSLFAKVVNYWFLQQAPAEAHRNRLAWLSRSLLEETARATATKPGIKIWNLGCGPAVEIQQFLKENDIPRPIQFVLMDFNEETLHHARACLEPLWSRHGATVDIRFERRSVQQVIKDSAKSFRQAHDRMFDMIYCAGLFDYLADPICQRLLATFYNRLAAGGLILCTNVDRSNPRRRTMESLLDWNLIYRNTSDAWRVIPREVPEEAVTIHSEGSGVNLFVEIRKPTDE